MSENDYECVNNKGEPMMADHKATTTQDSQGSPAPECSEADWLADQLGMSRERFQAAAERLRFKRLADYADQLHGAFYTMKHDWKNGDFELPRYAEIHMEAMESKALQLGKLLHQIQNTPTT